MGHINFEDLPLIQRWQVGKKMNVMNKKFKNNKKQGNCRKLFLIIVKSYERLRSYGVHRNMSAENAIKRLQKIKRKKKHRRVNRDGDRKKKHNCQEKKKHKKSYKEQSVKEC